jgi:hypothetical protein
MMKWIGRELDVRHSTSETSVLILLGRYWTDFLESIAHLRQPQRVSVRFNSPPSRQFMNSRKPQANALRLISCACLIGDCKPSIARSYVCRWLLTLLILGVDAPMATAEEAAEFQVEERTGSLLVSRQGKPVADYVFHDEAVRKPYFTRLHAPDGTQVTRSHPPVKGVDAVDHEFLHPGLWMAFGDLSGVDFWRNKGRIVHSRFLESPVSSKGRLSFAVAEKYLAADGAEVCQGVNQFQFIAGDTVSPRLPGTLLLWSTTLNNANQPLVFGPQHEMGLGLRVATPLVVQGGTGQITGSHGGLNEAGNWGRYGDWWNYGGVVNGRRAGVLLVPSNSNTRKVWTHARDYGFLALNPTGAPPDQQDVPSIPFTVPAGESLHLRFGVLLHSTTLDSPVVEAQFDPSQAASQIQAELQSWLPQPANKKE